MRAFMGRPSIFKCLGCDLCSYSAQYGTMSEYTVEFFVRPLNNNGGSPLAHGESFDGDKAHWVRNPPFIHFNSLFCGLLTLSVDLHLLRMLMATPQLSPLRAKGTTLVFTSVGMPNSAESAVEGQEI